MTEEKCVGFRRFQKAPCLARHADRRPGHPGCPRLGRPRILALVFGRLRHVQFREQSDRARPRNRLILPDALNADRLEPVARFHHQSYPCSNDRPDHRRNPDRLRHPRRSGPAYGRPRRARGHPGLAVILVGEDPGSVSYVAGKAKACEEAGIFSETFRLPETVSQDELFALVRQLNVDPRFHVILPQLPVPPHIDELAYIDGISAPKDADGLHPVNLGRLLRGELSGAIPCTPHGVLELLARTGNDPAGKHVVVSAARHSLVVRSRSCFRIRRRALTPP